jgi:PAS domain S-box-containing protein
MSVLDHLGDREVPEEVRAAVEADRLGALVCNHSRILDANDRFLRLVGFTRAELEAGELSWLRMTEPRWVADDARAIGQLRATGRADVYDKEFVRADGGRVGVRLADLRIELEPLRILAFVADTGDETERVLVDAVGDASR